MRYAAVEAQARLFARWLGFDVEDDASVWMQFPPPYSGKITLYEAVEALSEHQLDELLVLLAALEFGQVLCETLDTDESLFNAVARDLEIDMRNHWRPDRAFLERRTRDQLIAIACESGYAGGVGSVASYKKSELVNSRTDKGR